MGKWERKRVYFSAAGTWRPLRKSGEFGLTTIFVHDRFLMIEVDAGPLNRKDGGSHEDGHQPQRMFPHCLLILRTPYPYPSVWQHNLDTIVLYNLLFGREEAFKDQLIMWYPLSVSLVSVSLVHG